jgi:flagellar basal body-associated protein FliL
MAADAAKQGKTPNPPKAETAEAASPAEAARPQGGRLKGLFTIKALMIVMVLSLILHGIGLGYSHYASRGRADASEEPMEVNLGSYRFEAEPSEQGDVVGARFCLHIALIDDVEPRARQVLAQRQIRVQQNVEELLRQAHGGDFVDPTLGELKRQLQERINESLGVRMIADVIITNLEIHRKRAAGKSAATTASSSSKLDEPSS